MLAQQAQRLLDNDEHALPEIFRGAADSDLPDRAALSDLDVAVLVLAWEGDPAHPTSTAVELAGLIPGAELHVAADLDAARATWTPHILRFLAQNP
jgi:pimeloyl-ACP methyl ester carboxylesterase